MSIHGQGRGEIVQFGSNVVLDLLKLAETCLMLIPGMWHTDKTEKIEVHIEGWFSSAKEYYSIVSSAKELLQHCTE